MRKIFLAFFLIVFIGVSPMNVFASEEEPVQNDNRYIGNASISYFEDTGFIIVTMELDKNGNVIGTMPEIGEIRQNGDAEICGEVAKTITRTLYSNVYYAGGELAGRITTTITGSYSQVENWAQIEGVRAVAESADPLILPLSTECSKSGDTATVRIKTNGNTIGSLRYRIYTNGTIGQI